MTKYFRFSFICFYISSVICSCGQSLSHIVKNPKILHNVTKSEPLEVKAERWNSPRKYEDLGGFFPTEKLSIFNVCYCVHGE